MKTSGKKSAQVSWVIIKVHPNHKVKIDKADLKRVSEKKWRVTKGTQGRMRVVTTLKGGKHLTLGRFIMSPPKNKQVYPRRFNKELDYRKGNLIVCTVQERQRMLPKNRKGASSTYRGVSFQKRTKKWRAGIEVKGRTINLGDFKNEADAATAYNVAAKKYFGSEAYQNPVGRKDKVRRRD